MSDHSETPITAMLMQIYRKFEERYGPEMASTKTISLLENLAVEHATKNPELSDAILLFVSETKKNLSKQDS